MIKYVAGVLAVVLVGIMAVIFLGDGSSESAGESGVTNFKNATYEIEGEFVTLVDGRAEEEIAPDAASTVVTEYFGNEARGDLNGDGTSDVAFILHQTGGGSGTAYYVVAALQDPAGTYVGTNAVFLGDRISPQTTEIRRSDDLPIEGWPQNTPVLVVNFAERAAGEPMTAQPSVGVSAFLRIDSGRLVEAKP